MSWDVVVFNLNRKVETVEEIDDNLLVDIGTWTQFKHLLKAQFPEAVIEEDWCKIVTGSYSLETSLGEPNDTVSNTIFHLYGENAIYALVNLCRKYNWQAYDTHLGEMLNLENPEINGYANFSAYLDQIKQSR